MAIEKERRFLVKNELLQLEVAGTPIMQGYGFGGLSVYKDKLYAHLQYMGASICEISNHDAASIILAGDINPRVRMAGGVATLTLKGPRVNGSANEFEIQISRNKFAKMYKDCSRRIEKVRFVIGRFEVDIFQDGLMIAEIELEEDEWDIELPEWIGEEITNDEKMSSYAMSRRVTGDFSETLNEVMYEFKGRRRRSWPKGKFIRSFGPIKGIMLVDEGVGITPYEPTREDIMADDWTYQGN